MNVYSVQVGVSKNLVQASQPHVAISRLLRFRHKDYVNLLLSGGDTLEITIKLVARNKTLKKYNEEEDTKRLLR
jgi:tRNA A37 threonylcarbamoyltransferase TsaD